MPTSTVKQERSRIDILEVENRSVPRRTLSIQFFRKKIHVPASYLVLVLVSFVVGLPSHPEVSAQTLRARISVVSVAPGRVQVDLELPAATNILSFPNAYGGILGLGNRIERIEANVDGKTVSVRKLAPGEFETEQKATRLSYQVNLSGPVQPAQMSRVSWLNDEIALLMLSDLLPRIAMQPGGVASISLDVPSHWSISSNLKGREPNYLTTSPEKAIFLIGPSVRKKIGRAGVTKLAVITAGEWSFSDNEALKIAGKLVEEYAKVTGHALKSDPVLMLVPFAGNSGPERWTAETRGNAVVILMGNRAKRKQMLAKLGIVLTHEIFHLWVPNELALTGEYDWFFEGFTLYQALRMALRLKLISFETFLETIARVYDSYISSADSTGLSLIEASERRWTTASSLVYDKGMLAAFLYDLTLRASTECRESLDDIYRHLFRHHGAGQGSANETIIRILSAPPNMNSFGRDYVGGKGPINLQSALASYGIQLRSDGPGGQATQLTLDKDLNKVHQKALRCLGYRG